MGWSLINLRTLTSQNSLSLPYLRSTPPTQYEANLYLTEAPAPLL